MRNTVRCDPVTVAGPFQLREIAYAPGLKQPVHAHDTMGITLVVSGSIREGVRSREEIGAPLSVVIKPVGVEHSDEVGPGGARTLQILFYPRETSGLAEDAGGLDAWRWLHGQLIAAPMIALLNRVRTRGSGAADLETRVYDVLAAVPENAPARGEPPRWIRRVREALDDQLAAGVSVIDLARLAGTHAVSVSRAFRRHFGCSITEYRRRERLRRAASHIGASVQPLSTIAHASGYADHAHLCRDFRDAMGVTPSEFRDLSRNA